MPQPRMPELQQQPLGLLVHVTVLGNLLSAMARGTALILALSSFGWTSAAAQDVDKYGLYLSDFTWAPAKPILGIKLYYIRSSNRAEIVEHDLATNRLRRLRLQDDRWEFLCLVRTEVRTKGADEVSDFGVGGCNSRFDSVSIVGVASPFRAITANPHENDVDSGMVEMGKLLEKGKNDHLQLRFRPYSTPLDQHFYDSQSVAPDATTALTTLNVSGSIVPVCRHFDFQMGDLSKIGGITLIRSYTKPLDVAKYHMWNVADDQRLQSSFQEVLQISLFDRSSKSSPEQASTTLPCRRAIYLEDGKVLIEANHKLVLLDAWTRTASIIAEDAEEPIAVRVLR